MNDLEIPHGPPPKLLGWTIIVLSSFILLPGIFFFHHNGSLELMLLGLAFLAAGILIRCGRVWGLYLYILALVPMFFIALVLNGNAGGNVLGGLIIHGVIVGFTFRELSRGNLW